jgi:hypothetical protein
MNTSEVRYKAADHIERFGHHKGDGFGEGHTSVAPACTIGAITVASECGVHPGQAAIAAMVSFLGSGIITWNDAPERTAAEVVEALRAAAVIEAAKENSDTRASVTA